MAISLAFPASVPGAGRRLYHLTALGVVWLAVGYFVVCAALLGDTCRPVGFCGDGCFELSAREVPEAHQLSRWETGVARARAAAARAKEQGTILTLGVENAG